LSARSGRGTKSGPLVVGRQAKPQKANLQRMRKLKGKVTSRRARPLWGAVRNKKGPANHEEPQTGGGD